VGEEAWRRARSCFGVQRRRGRRARSRALPAQQRVEPAVTEAAQSMPRIIATIDARNGYDGLQAAVRARVAETGLNSRMIDELSGLTPGYTGKLLGAAQINQFGVTALLAIMATLGLRFDVAVDPLQEALMRPHWECGDGAQRRNQRLARLGKMTINRVLPEVMRELGKRRVGKLTPEQRSALGRKAGLASGRARLRRGLMNEATEMIQA
jgi:hypothetical protein